jgi:predicted acylesterase/phospholipase RssA
MTWRRVLGVLLLGLALASCTTLKRLDAPPRALAVAPAGFSPSIRFSAFDSEAMRMRLAPRYAGCVRVLALSGGGSGGAFGAGALSGWSQAGGRPHFDIVTGVSTGALAAPFAFIGPTWDGQLKASFTGGFSNELLRASGASAVFGASVFKGRPLRELIDRFITTDVVAAVAEESRTGRVLLVATSNLDTEEAVIWDMGKIAEAGGDKALALFRDVLAASASAPGVFPPVMIRVDGPGGPFEEMHVDGGVTTPFFVAPFVDATQLRQGGDVCANVFVVVNAGLADPAVTTRRSTVTVAGRALNALMNQTVRSELLRIDALARLYKAQFHFTLVPTAYGALNSASFAQAEMTRLFTYAERCAKAGELWMSSVSEPAAIRGDPDGCPAPAKR